VATRANLHDDAALWAGNVAATAVQFGQFERAENLNRQAIALKAKTGRSTLYNQLNAAHIAAGRGDAPGASALYEQILHAGASDPAVEWEAHAGLARVALAGGRSTNAMRHFDAALDGVERMRADLLKAEYRMTFLTRVIRFYQDYVEALVSAGQAEKALAVADSSRAVVLAERMGGLAPPHSRAARRLPAPIAGRSVWLSYWLGPDRSHVWVVRPSGVRHAALPPAAEIERLVAEYSAFVQSGRDPLAAAPSPGDALFSAIVKPVANDIPPGAELRIVPDGPLHGINFETLPVGQGGTRHYWIEDVTLAVAPSLALLAGQAEPSGIETPPSLLLVGDPTPRPPEFPRLGYAPVEMQAVARHFSAGRTVRFDGDRASPSAYFDARPDRFSLIHFTAHGEANRASPLDSAVILSGPPGADKLYARDVADRPLRAALVTISACRSAGERAYAGEGLIGFAWAFLRAGAHQVVAGLWDVDDQSTATLMDALYGGIARGETAPAALRAAKLSLISRGGNVAKPYYWGPFEVFTVRP
jgi:CHAT domain-containing protein